MKTKTEAAVRHEAIKSARQTVSAGGNDKSKMMAGIGANPRRLSGIHSSVQESLFESLFDAGYKDKLYELLDNPALPGRSEEILTGVLFVKDQK